MEKTLGIVLGLTMLMVVVGMVQAAQPVAEYTCPIDGEKFFTYDELYQHFITEHPATPIDIIWE